MLRRIQTPARAIDAAPPGTSCVMLAAFDQFEVPCVIRRASRVGKTLIVSAGIHGSEYSAIEAAQRLIRTPDIGLECGTLAILPMMNPSAFYSRKAYVALEDSKNLNRVFPGDRDGTHCERLAEWMCREVFSVADAYVDLHSGDLCEALVPFSVFQYGDAYSETLARAVGFTVAIAADNHNMAISAASACGVPAILCESGGHGQCCPQAASRLVRTVQRVMSELGMGGVGRAVEEVECHTRSWKIHLAPEAGLWYPARSAGECVEQGEVLGEIRDVYGRSVASPCAVAKGQILYHICSLAVSKGESLVAVAVHE